MDNSVARRIQEVDDPGPPVFVVVPGVVQILDTSKRGRDAATVDVEELFVHMPRVAGIEEELERLVARLIQADEEAPMILARNELALLAGIVVYGLLKLTWLRESGA